MVRGPCAILNTACSGICLSACCCSSVYQSIVYTTSWFPSYHYLQIVTAAFAYAPNLLSAPPVAKMAPKQALCFDITDDNQNSSSKSERQPLGSMDLPAEIRNKIYIFSLNGAMHIDKRDWPPGTSQCCRIPMHLQIEYDGVYRPFTRWFSLKDHFLTINAGVWPQPSMSLWRDNHIHGTMIHPDPIL